MLKTLGKLLLLLLVIGLAVFAVVSIINSSNSTSMELPSGDRLEGLQPGQSFNPDNTGINRPTFEGHGRKQEGGGINAAYEIFKNLGIIALVTGVTVIVSWRIAKIPHFHRLTNG